MKKSILTFSLSLLLVGLATMFASCGADGDEARPVVCVMESMVDMTGDGVAR